MLRNPLPSSPLQFTVIVQMGRFENMDTSTSIHDVFSLIPPPDIMCVHVLMYSQSYSSSHYFRECAIMCKSEREREREEMMMMKKKKKMRIRDQPMYEVGRKIEGVWCQMESRKPREQEKKKEEKKPHHEKDEGEWRMRGCLTDTQPKCWIAYVFLFLSPHPSLSLSFSLTVAMCCISVVICSRRGPGRKTPAPPNSITPKKRG